MNKNRRVEMESLVKQGKSPKEAYEGTRKNPKAVKTASTANTKVKKSPAKKS